MRKLNVEDYILDGTCNECDQDPCQCLCEGYCFYENCWGEDNEEEMSNEE